MNALTEKPPIPSARTAAPGGALRPQGARGGYAGGFLIALGIHAVLALALPREKSPDHPVEFAVVAGDSSVEVSLVAAPPAEADSAPVEQPPEVVPPPPPPPQSEPEPEPPPPVPEKAPEMTLPVPEPKPQEIERKRAPQPKERAPKPQSKPHPVAPARRAVGDGSSKIAGSDATTVTAASGGTTAKAGYLRNPHPTYPEEARAAGQQGVVNLRVRVDVSGHVASVQVARSSGFAMLDERARSTVAERWVFKPATSGGVPVPSEVVIPIRFTLDR